MKDIYESEFVADLFDKMSDSYERVNVISSFGFSARWRRQCVEQLNIEENSVIVDLMTGMGECWKYILRDESKVKKLIALDISKEMIKRASLLRSKYKECDIELRHENVFENKIKGDSVDYIVSGFGLKTFNDIQLRNLATEMDRILKPGGEFSLIDVSVPESRFLRVAYLYYLKKVIPFLGRLLLGNPETYRMLGIYTEIFENSERALKIFRGEGLEVEYVNYFFGCASGIKGYKK